MSNWPDIVKSFPLSVPTVIHDYNLIPSDSEGIFYHFTTNSGLEGILRDGGIRARYRMSMNDPGEFSYARDLIFAKLERIGELNDLPPVAQSLTSYTRKNLDIFLSNTTEVSSAYCACLTAHTDDIGQWDTYAECGTGFAIGFDLFRLLKMQRLPIQQGEPYVFCSPVIYEQQDQCEFVQRLIGAGVRDLQSFASKCSQQPDHLSALRDRITREIVNELFVAIDFIKDPRYRSERELRFIQDSNDGTLNAPHIQHYRLNNQSIPYIFMDFRDPNTGLMPLAEIRMGPKGDLPGQKDFLDNLLDELGYNNDSTDRPRIV